MFEGGDSDEEYIRGPQKIKKERQQTRLSTDQDILFIPTQSPDLNKSTKFLKQDEFEADFEQSAAKINWPESPLENNFVLEE